MRLAIGKTVMIYHDPISCEQPEGRAKLMREQRPDEGDGLSLWLVKFVGYDCDPLCLRTINARHAEIER